MFTTQPELTVQVLEDFRQEIIGKPFNDTPIWQVMKEKQNICNGFGAQEATDALFDALIHPRMPISLVCKDDRLWTRWLETIKAHHTMRVNRIMSPQLLGERPLPHIFNGMFCMNMDGIALVSCAIAERKCISPVTRSSWLIAWGCLILMRSWMTLGWREVSTLIVHSCCLLKTGPS